MIKVFIQYGFYTYTWFSKSICKFTIENSKDMEAETIHDLKLYIETYEVN